jgi:hypothetical protein
MTWPFQAIFAGEIESLMPCPASIALGEWARGIVADEFGPQPERLAPADFREALSRARAAVAEEQGRRLVCQLLRDLEVPVEGVLLDAVRLRAISPGLERVPEAAPAFYAHRDTWYGNPKAQVNGWLPLIDVDERDSFRFYLDDFARAVENDSDSFEVAHFEARGGFGRTTSDPVSAYPRALKVSDSRTWDVVLQQDALLLFSAAHLHQTLPNRKATVRFSLDFRFLRQSDLQEGKGAPDPDNRSRGCVTTSYHRCH